MSKSQTKRSPILNIIILIVAFFVIGMVLGPNINQVYTGTSAAGADTVELTNNGNLDTKVRDFTVNTLPVVVSGGTVTTDGDYTVHTFTSSGVFTTSGVINAEVLVVAGGGGGGGAYVAGGGGGGGVVHGDSYAIPSGDTVVTVGFGGLGGLLDFDGGNGGDSAFGSIISIGGGGGDGLVGGNGLDGGSGGGSSKTSAPGIGLQCDSSGCTGYGNDGGGSSDTTPAYGGGGGGGAGSVGGAGTSALPGEGGDGMAFSINGTSVYYGGGGGGARNDIGAAGSGGLGGGGDGAAQGVSATAGVDNTGGGGGGGRDTALLGKDGGDGIVIIRYLLPSSDVSDPFLSVGDDKLYYDGTLSSTLTCSDGSAYIDSSDVSASMKGGLPIIKVGTTQNIKIDHDLEYSITYLPKNMDITSSGMFRAGEDMCVDTRLTDTSGNPTSYQPLEIRIRLFDSNDKQYLDEIVSSTSFVIPGKYLHDNKHYQLRLSYEGYEFGGWSNEVLADFDIGTEGFTITSSPDKAPEGIAAASFAAVEGLVGMAVTGWLDVPIIGDIIRFIVDLVGVEL